MNKISDLDVKQFLDCFLQKANLYGIIYRDDRTKNQATLETLEIIPSHRDAIIKSLTVTDYAQGPFEDTLYKGSEMWVFGKEVKKREIYIKISLGMAKYSPVCISFHIAEHPLAYPFKTKGKKP